MERDTGRKLLSGDAVVFTTLAFVWLFLLPVYGPLADWLAGFVTGRPNSLFEVLSLVVSTVAEIEAVRDGSYGSEFAMFLELSLGWAWMALLLAGFSLIGAVVTRFLGPLRRFVEWIVVVPWLLVLVVIALLVIVAALIPIVGFLVANPVYGYEWLGVAGLLLGILLGVVFALSVGVLLSAILLGYAALVFGPVVAVLHCASALPLCLAHPDGLLRKVHDRFLGATDL